MPFNRWSDMTGRVAGGGAGALYRGVLIQPPLLPNVTKCKVEFTAPPHPPESRIGPPKEHVRGTMACPSQAGRAWVTAAMFIGQLR